MNTRSIRTLTALTSLLALGATAPDAHAYEIQQARWGAVEWFRPLLSPDMVMSTLSSSDATAIEEASVLWNDSLGNLSISPFQGDSSYAVGNYDSEIARVCDDLFTSGEDARTWLVYDINTGWIWEADTYINDCGDDPVRRTTDAEDRVAYGGTDVDLVSLMVSHLGQQLGLVADHSQMTTIGYNQTAIGHNGIDAVPYVGADAGLGAVALYGTGWTREQVGLSHFKWTESSEADERLAFTEVYDPNGRRRPSTTSGGMPRYKVWPGGDLDVEVTLEGLGSAVGMVGVDYYLSTNTTITADDTWLGAEVIPAVMGMVATFSAPVSIPSGTPPGEYAIGVVATSAGTETATDNNTTVVLIEVMHAWEPCTAGAPCGHREGDCDTNADCTDGTTCVHNVGAEYGASPLTDICELPLWSYCTPEFPCLSGEGDCDVDADCLSGSCRHDVGNLYGYASASLDVCQ
jgi:hypothetical protein